MDARLANPSRPIPQKLEMEDMFPLRESNVKHNFRKVQHKSVIFFPSSHDIFFENADAYVLVVKKLIDAGNDIMYTALSGRFPKGNLINLILKLLKK